MDLKSIPSTERPAWKALVAHQQKIRDLHLRKLFADDPTRQAHDRRGGRFIESKEKPALNHDSSTNNLIYQYRKSKKAN